MSMSLEDAYKIVKAIEDGDAAKELIMGTARRQALKLDMGLAEWLLDSREVIDKIPAYSQTGRTLDAVMKRMAKR